MDASPPKVSKQTDATEKKRKPGKTRDEDYQLQNTPGNLRSFTILINDAILCVYV